MKKLDDIVQQEIRFYKQNKAKIFYEAAVSELLEQFPLDKAREIMIFYLNELDK